MASAEEELEKRSKFLSSLIQKKKKKSVEQEEDDEVLNVRIRASDMPIALQNKAFKCARDHLDSMPAKRLDSKRLALALKKDFDAEYGPAWHCIVGTSFGSFVTHSLGGFLYFSIDKIEDILGEHATLFKEHYYVKSTGNCDLSRMSDPHNEFRGKSVLIERSSTEALAKKQDMSIEQYLEILGLCRKKLFDVRSKRPHPHLDDKVIVSWNGLVISSFARASKILKGEPDGLKHYFPVAGCDPYEYIEVAEKAVLFIHKNLYDKETKRLQHSFRKGPAKAPGFLDDYAFLISALLDLYECGGRTKWLEWAAELQDTQDELFMDKEGGGYFNTPGEDPSVLLRVKEDHDGAEPSGNSVAAVNLVRLASIFSDSQSDRYKKNADLLLATFQTRLKDMPMAVPLMCCAADMLAIPSRKQVVLVGQKISNQFDSMLVAAHAAYDPNKTIIHIDPSDPEEMNFWEANNKKIASMAKGNFYEDKVIGLICQNFTCKPPVSDPASLEALLAKEN